MNKTIGILAHVDGGKTTLCEEILYNTNSIRKKGRVDHKDSYFDSNKIIIASPNNSYEVLGIKFYTVRAYNINKSFHSIDNDWVGYIINIE